jgi:hypothetical protein
MDYLQKYRSAIKNQTFFSIYLVIGLNVESLNFVYQTSGILKLLH